MAADVVCDSADVKKTFHGISLSRKTVATKTEKISQDIRDQLDKKIGEFTAYSIALDETTDTTDTAQMAIFIRGVNRDLDITEDLLSLCSMHDTTTGRDILKEVLSVVEKRKLDLTKLSAIATDGAPAMVGKTNGFSSLLCAKMKEDGITPLPLKFHCIIHQQNLAAKNMNMEHVLSVVKEVVLFLRQKGLKHRQFRAFLEEIDSEYEDVPFYAQVRWLSRGKMMLRAYNLQGEIIQFYGARGKELPEFHDSEFLDDFAFLVDMLQLLNSLNTKLQGKDQLISDMYHCVATFHGHLEIWGNQFEAGEPDSESFPTFTGRPSSPDTQKYCDVITSLKDEFEKRFMDFKEIKVEICLFSAILLTEDIPARLQLEVIALRNDPVYSAMFVPGQNLHKAYRALPALQYPRLRAFASRLISMFGSTYRCEQLFSRLGYVKNKFRNRLTDAHVADILHISASDHMPNYQQIMDNSQSQMSH